MNLFNHIREVHGQSTVKDLRKYEKCEKRYRGAKYKYIGDPS